MLGFFPTLYPGELLYSGIARYQIRSGNLSPKANIEELFNSRNITATADLPCGLDNLVQNLPPCSSITADNLIQNHTLYPFYAPFLPPKRAKLVYRLMKSTKGRNIHTTAGVMASVMRTLQYFRFCPKCLQSDLNEYGETYWHRLHQIQGVIFCPVHEIPLQNSSVSIQTSNRHQYEAASELNCSSKSLKHNYNKTTVKHLVNLAEDIAKLLENNYSSQTFEWFTKKYQTLLTERGYANVFGRVRQKKLIDDFIYFYNAEFLEITNSIVAYKKNNNWVSRIARKHRQVFHPIRHLLIIRFLEESVDSFFNNNRQYRPFGISPWLCLNAAADHYLQPVVTDLKISHCIKNKQPLGTFSCDCGMVYSRSGEDKKEQDKLRIGRVINYGWVWKDKLRELVEVKQLKLAEVARELKVDPKTVKRYVDLLDLTPLWNQHKLHKLQTNNNTKKAKLVNYKEIKRQKRNIWLKLQQEHPKLSKTELRKLAPDIYAWLYRRDRTWLNNNSPKLRQAKPLIGKVDWSIRDEQILIQVQNEVSKLLDKDKPVRITISRVGVGIGLKVMLEKSLDKLPKTKAYLESVLETVEDFQIRRVEWAIAKLENRGEEVKEWKVLRLAGLRSDLSYQVAQYLFQHC
ncbi:MAG: TnsD family transposase [Cyanobacteria bacterium P01_A01_bin.84]